MVLLVDLQVRREHVDALGEERDLHLGRAGVGLVEAVLADRGGGVRHRQVRSLPAPCGRWIGEWCSRVRIAAAVAATAEPTIHPRTARTQPLSREARMSGGSMRRRPGGCIALLVALVAVAVGARPGPEAPRPPDRRRRPGLGAVTRTATTLAPAATGGVPPQ